MTICRKCKSEFFIKRCPECQKERHKKYYEKNKDKIKEYSKKHIEQNKEHRRMIVKKSYEKNKDKRHEYYIKHRILSDGYAGKCMAYKKGVELTAEMVRELFNYDSETGLFTRKISINNKYKAGDFVGFMTDGYVKLKIARVAYWCHRLAWLHFYGNWPVYQIDHINGIKTDNRISNLRDVPQVTNVENLRTAKKKIGLLGTAFNKSSKKWTSQITAKGKTYHLGSFETEQLAHDAYVNAKRELHEGCTI